MVTGNLNSYNEASFNRINDIAYTTFEGFVQDSWKVSKRLTFELGIRITHFTPWADNTGAGYSIFDYSKYSPSCKPTDYCGFIWHKRDPSVPIGEIIRPDLGQHHTALSSPSMSGCSGWELGCSGHSGQVADWPARPSSSTSHSCS